LIHQGKYGEVHSMLNKSISSLYVGIAMEKGIIKGTEQFPGGKR